MKKNVLGWMAVPVLLTLACGMIVPTTLPSQPGVETIVAATLQALTAAPPPTVAPSPTTEPEVSLGTTVTYNNITLALPTGLASNATGAQIPAADEQTTGPWGVAPEYIELKLDGYVLAEKFHDPKIYVYPAQEFAAVHPNAANSISRLQAILASPEAPLTNDALPHLPFANAAQIFFTQPKILSFQNGSGIRFLTEYAQYFATVNNPDLFYHFQGLTSDGKYYIIAILPVTAPILAADENPESPIPGGGITFPGYDGPEADMQAYYENVTRALDTIDPDAFSPSLMVLDSMIKSIRIDTQ